jgi:hypothetical protein
LCRRLRSGAKPSETPRKAKVRYITAAWIRGEVVVEEDEDALAREAGVVALELLEVEAAPPVVPGGRPAATHPLLLGIQGGREVGDRLEAVPAELEELRVGSVDGVAQQGEQRHLRKRLADPARGLGDEHVRDRRLPDRGGAPRAGEEAL